MITFFSVLQTANFQSMGDGREAFALLRATQPDKPLMVMELWAGWFDHWGEKHHTTSTDGKYISRKILD